MTFLPFFFMETRGMTSWDSFMGHENMTCRHWFNVFYPHRWLIMRFRAQSLLCVIPFVLLDIQSTAQATQTRMHARTHERRHTHSNIKPGIWPGCYRKCRLVYQTRPRYQEERLPARVTVGPVQPTRPGNPSWHHLVNSLMTSITQPSAEMF